jgi:hypothetical protein
MECYRLRFRLEQTQCHNHHATTNVLRCTPSELNIPNTKIRPGFLSNVVSVGDEDTTFNSSRSITAAYDGGDFIGNAPINGEYTV